MYTVTMHETYLGNDAAAALNIVAELYDSDVTTRVITDGHENLIIAVDETYVVRFPRTEEVWKSSKKERYVIEKLSRHAAMPISRLLKTSESPAYIITTYLKGDQITTKQIRSLPEDILQNIGKQIATFAYTFHTTIPIDEFRPFFTPPTWSYDDYLKRVLFDRQDPNPKVDALAKTYYHKWLDTKKAKDIVVHDDLHTGNLLFDDRYHLTGVLDFGATCIGSAEQELRQAYRFGDAALEAAALTYEQLSGRPFDQETAKLWTITQELGAYCREDTDVVHERARENLHFWFPDIWQ
jgi:aminoglycoside phosphotransferase (APT) family kinase protein